MSPHKKILEDEASGIEYENQRYLDYQGGVEASDKKWRQILKDAVAMAKLAGIREVVGWIEKHAHYSVTKDGFVLDECEWQAKLKEWGKEGIDDESGC